MRLSEAEAKEVAEALRFKARVMQQLDVISRADNYNYALYKLADRFEESFARREVDVAIEREGE